MLAGLDDIPWADLEHAYGSAADVPGLLRKLLDPDPKVRSNVMWTLYGNVFHQGTRYPATPYVIPFLVELCERPHVSNRGELLRFWGSLITGFFSVQERPCWGDGTHVYMDGEIQPAEEDEYTTALHEIYRRSIAVRPLLFDLLSADDIAIRAEAAYVLACLPTIAAESRPILRERLDREPSGWVRAALAFALGELGDAASLERVLAVDDHPAARCMAACQLTRIAPSERLIDDLLHLIAEPIDGYENVPGAGGQSTDDAAFSTAYLPLDVRRKAIPAICDRLEHARSFATMPLVTALLSAAFEPRSEPLTQLNELQRQVLLRMLNTQELWTIGNLFFTFQAYGLPQDRQKCAGLTGVRVADDKAFSELSSAVTFADMGFLDKAREGIEKALSLDPAVFARAPSPAECWLYCAKAFAETDAAQALKAFKNAEAIDPNVTYKVGVTWKLADLIRDRESD